MAGQNLPHAEEPAEAGVSKRALPPIRGPDCDGFFEIFAFFAWSPWFSGATVKSRTAQRAAGFAGRDP